ncbi:hypothetical protein CFP65_2265 [Kitasatospora sp. MMS16-BH015]|uniref:hypothetical protein n=1 Tax=Kitasatospora sp. MMS16-BH015 TaxID=2018025 RepID=UPI000CA0BD22|nr:hypothetical protein [Kitasatospora sp. MMS16-BH015]AUG77105.1 hypothetical protein CFP65_2265 [Kitasatospora sp. MMS16-BH015]
MSQSFPPPPQPEAPSSGGAGPRKRLARLVPRRRGARWAALAAAVVIVGGGVAAVAVAEHHHRAEQGGAFAAGHGKRTAAACGAGRQHQGGHGEHGRADQGAEHGKRGERLGMNGAAACAPGHRPAGTAKPAPGTGSAGQLAPAPLPALPADQAAAKAAAAVPGGKVESLSAVGQQGGGSAWLAVVLGPDGVRHRVTLAGADGTPTSNIVTEQTPAGGPAVTH